MVHAAETAWAAQGPLVGQALEHCIHRAGVPHVRSPTPSSCLFQLGSGSQISQVTKCTRKWDILGALMHSRACLTCNHWTAKEFPKDSFLNGETITHLERWKLIGNHRHSSQVFESRSQLKMYEKEHLKWKVWERSWIDHRYLTVGVLLTFILLEHFFSPWTPGLVLGVPRSEPKAWSLPPELLGYRNGKHALRGLVWNRTSGGPHSSFYLNKDLQLQAEVQSWRHEVSRPSVVALFSPEAFVFRVWPASFSGLPVLRLWGLLLFF